MASVAGILEHVVFLLQDKKIPFEVKFYGPEEGFDEAQIIVKFTGRFLHIVKRSSRVAYYIADKGKKRRVISKQELLKLVRNL